MLIAACGHTCGVVMQMQARVEAVLRRPVTPPPLSDAAEAALEEERRNIEEMVEAEVTQLVDQEEQRTRQEMNRFADALRYKIQERCKATNTQLPPLCNCFDDFWETDPSKCANNCPLYENRPRFVRLLSSLLPSFKLI